MLTSGGEPATIKLVEITKEVPKTTPKTPIERPKSSAKSTARVSGGSGGGSYGMEEFEDFGHELGEKSN